MGEGCTEPFLCSGREKRLEELLRPGLSPGPGAGRTQASSSPSFAATTLVSALSSFCHVNGVITAPGNCAPTARRLGEGARRPCFTYSMRSDQRQLSSPCSKNRRTASCPHSLALNQGPSLLPVSPRAVSSCPIRGRPRALQDLSGIRGKARDCNEDTRMGKPILIPRFAGKRDARASFPGFLSLLNC